MNENAGNSVTRLGDVSKFLSKVAQILDDYLGYFEKDIFLSNTTMDLF